MSPERHPLRSLDAKLKTKQMSVILEYLFLYFLDELVSLLGGAFSQRRPH